MSRRITEPYWSSAEDETRVRLEQGRMAWFLVGLAAAVLAGVGAMLWFMLAASP